MLSERGTKIHGQVRASGDFEDSLLTLQLAGAELETMAGWSSAN